MAVSRVDFSGRTLMDLTADTVEASALLVGYTAHGADGEPISGSLDMGNMTWGELEALEHSQSWGDVES